MVVVAADRGFGQVKWKSFDRFEDGDGRGGGVCDGRRMLWCRCRRRYPVRLQPHLDEDIKQDLITTLRGSDGIKQDLVTTLRGSDGIIVVELDGILALEPRVSQAFVILSIPVV